MILPEPDFIKEFHIEFLNKTKTILLQSVLFLYTSYLNKAYKSISTTDLVKLVLYSVLLCEADLVKFVLYSV